MTDETAKAAEAHSNLFAGNWVHKRVSLTSFLAGCAHLQAKVDEYRDRSERLVNLELLALQSRDRHRMERDRLASDALVILSANGICTPEKGYVDAPYMLALDIKTLAIDRDRYKAALEEISQHRDTVTSESTGSVQSFPSECALTASHALKGGAR